MVVFSNIDTLYDGASAETKSVHRHVDLWINGSKIEKVRPHDPKVIPTETLRVVNCSGLTVTPGLFDCHSHLTALGLDGDGMRLMNQSQSWLYFVEKILYTTLVDGGVTTVRDIGGATHFIKRMVENGVLIGPRLKIAISMLSTTGGHADFRGPDRCHATMQAIWPEMPGRPSNVVDGPWECRKRVREVAACGADLIKICASPGVASPSDKLENRDFTPEEIAAICEEATARGLKVAAHAHSKNGIRMAIEHGVYDIQHISFMDQELVEKAHARGCTVTPTSWVLREILNQPEGLSQFVLDKVKQVNEVHQKAVEYAAQGGLKILAGTDPVMRGMHGKNFLELHWLIVEGLKPLQAWYGATGLAAQEICEPGTGVIAPGNRADLLFCKGEVLNHPKLLGEGALLEVVKDGEGYRGHMAEIPQRTFRTNVGELLSKIDKSYF
jgi:imidazolonepropionase-like amidohydrolase